MAVTLVAAALCADRAASAAPTLRPPIAESAKQIAGKLTQSFRQALPVVQLDPVAAAASAEAAVPSRSEAPIAAIHPAEISPYQFRLPPPSL